MESDPSNRRKYPRFRAPKGTWVTWKATGKNNSARAKDMGLGGFYLLAANPPSEGSTIELLLNLPGGQICGRAIVRYSTPGKGMGVQFVHMKPEDRAILNRFLAKQEACDDAPVKPSAADSQATIAHPENLQLAVTPVSEKMAQLRFEREVGALVELTGKATYYQLLGISAEFTVSQIKTSYHTLARKFHPDSHMGDPELSGRLKNLMAALSEAYKTLRNDEKRAAYDKSLAASGAFSLGREESETAESIEEWLTHANECLRANNFVGSIVWLNKCVEAAPKQASHHALLARSLGTVQEYRNEAIEHFQKAIELDPWKELVYVQFAELLEEMKLMEYTRTIYSKLLEISPTHEKATERLATLGTVEKSEETPSILNLFS
jgi:curved DNA-binding protein CbpA